MLRRLAVLVVLALVLPLTAAAQDGDASWDTLAKVSVERQGSRFMPVFGDDVRALDGQRVELQGFMMPLDQAPKQQTFILSANPVQGCYYCLPGGPESMVEVRAETPIEFTYDPVVISGTLVVLDDDPSGVYYRLTDARIGS